MDIRDRLRAVPRSYEDFVNYTFRRIEENDSLRDAVIERLNSDPEANSSDILELVVNFLGLGEPLEIVDVDDEEGVYVGTVGAASGMIRAAY